MSTRVLTIVMVLLAVSVGLAATNPTMGDYKAFVDELLNQAIEQKRGTARDQDEQMLRSQARQLVASLLASATVRRDWGVFSLFETKILGSDLLILGIGHRFIPMKGVEELNEKIHRLAPATGF